MNGRLLRNEGMYLKRLFTLMLVAGILLAACNSSQLSISELESVPSKVQDVINSDSTLQMITSGEKTPTLFFTQRKKFQLNLK